MASLVNIYPGILKRKVSAVTQTTVLSEEICNSIQKAKINQNIILLLEKSNLTFNKRSNFTWGVNLQPIKPAISF